MKKQSVILLFVLTCGALAAQNHDLKRINHWYFGYGAGLDFTGGAPVPDENGALYVAQGCAAMSDTSGNLLFYTDAYQVFNAQHQLMPHGTGIGLIKSTPRDGAVIIPKPGSDSLYYLFNVDGWENQFERGIRWHLIDMSADGGLGDVVDDNNMLFTPVSEQLAATRHANGCDYWVVTHEWHSDRFLAYLVTADGVQAEPVVSAIGPDFSVLQQGYYLAGGNSLVFSPDGQWAVQKCYSGPIQLGFVYSAQLLRFNTNTGEFYALVEIPVDVSVSMIIFSPDSNILYTESNDNIEEGIYQFDLTLATMLEIADSRQLVAQFPLHISNDEQIGPDGKIYLNGEWDWQTSTGNPHFLSVIENPNVWGTECNVNYGVQPLGSGQVMQGLPTFVSNFTAQVAPPPCGTAEVVSISHSTGSHWSLWPNPTSGPCSVQCNGDYSAEVAYTLTDATGRLIISGKQMYQGIPFTLDLHYSGAGIYQLTLSPCGSPLQGAETIKIIIQP